MVNGINMAIGIPGIRRPVVRNFIYLCCFVLFFSCKNSTQSGVDRLKEPGKQTARKTKPPGSYPDTVRIKPPAAVFFSPDSIQLEKIKAVTAPAVFESQLHEYYYQIRNSKIVLKKYYPGVKIIEAKNCRYLWFLFRNGSGTYYDLDSQGDPFGLLIFDGVKDPRLVDMTNIDTDLGFYFSKS
jgi:hypothetical protein